MSGDTEVQLIAELHGASLLACNRRLIAELQNAGLIVAEIELDPRFGGSSSNAVIPPPIDTVKVYELVNNQSLTDVTGFVLDSTEYSSYFMAVEVERVGSLTYRQCIDIKAVYDGSVWSISMGNFMGSDLIQSVILNPEEIILSVTALGAIQYASGNLASHSKSNIKVISTGIKK